MHNVSERAVESLTWQVTPISQFADLRTEWDALNRRCADSPLLDFDFVRIAIEHFGSGDEVVAHCRRGDESIAVGVFVQNKMGSWATFQAAQAPLGAWICGREASLIDVLDGLRKALPKWPLIIALTQQDPLLTERPGSSDRLTTIDYIETASVTVEGTFEEYWSARGKNLKQNQRRQRNRLEREGTTVKMEVLTGKEDMSMAVRDYGDLESAGWKGENGSAVHADNVQGKFYSELLMHYAQRNEALVYRYYYDDKLVSTDLCLHRNGVMMLLKTTYDETQKTTSPTMLMRYEISRDIFENNTFESVEFYGRVMEWHKRWTNEIRTMYHVNFYRSGALRGIAKLAGRDG